MKKDYSICSRPPLNSFIHIDPFKDLNRIAKRRLDYEDLSYDQDDENLYVQLLNWYNKQIPVRPRSIVKSKNLIIPKENESGYNALVTDILKGRDLHKYLPTNTEKAHFIDTLLNTEGLVHFHLNDQLDKPCKRFKRRYVVRSGNILIAKVTEERIYFLTVEPHKNQDWEPNEYAGLTARDLTFFHDKYLRIMVDEFPELVEKRKFIKMESVLEDGTLVDIDTKQKAYLKKKHTNSMMQINDHSYMDEVVSASGHKAEHVQQVNQFNNKIALEMIEIADHLLEKFELNPNSKYQLELKTFNSNNEKLYVLKIDGREVLDILFKYQTIQVTSRQKVLLFRKPKSILATTIEKAIN